jgi:hypothetical protein
MISLCTLLETTKKKYLNKLQVLKDSKLVIEWAQGRENIQNMRLESIMRDINLAFLSFEWFSFHHILKEINSKTNKLSKDALELQSGTFVFYEYLDGVKIEAMEFRF